jgi:hypothetical protein
MGFHPPFSRLKTLKNYKIECNHWRKRRMDSRFYFSFWLIQKLNGYPYPHSRRVG